MSNKLEQTPSIEHDFSIENKPRIDQTNLSEMRIYFTAHKNLLPNARLQINIRNELKNHQDEQIIAELNTSGIENWEKHPTHYEELLAEAERRLLI